MDRQFLIFAIIISIALAAGDKGPRQPAKVQKAEQTIASAEGLLFVPLDVADTADETPDTFFRVDWDDLDDDDNNAESNWRVDRLPIKPLPKACEEECGVAMPRASEKILGGGITAIEQYPFLAFLKISSCTGGEVSPYVMKSCTAFIVGRRHVITAAHCLYVNLYEDHICVYGKRSADSLKYLTESASMEVPAKRLSLTVGRSSVNPDDTDSGRKINVSRFAIAVTYDPKGSTKEDIAIFELAEPLTYSESVHHACIEKNFASETGDTMVVSGFGRHETETASGLIIEKDGRLRSVFVRLIDPEYCETRFPSVSGIDNPNATICGGLFNSGTNSGDSGSPLFKVESNRAMVVGVASESGRQDINDSTFVERQTFPDSYTRLDVHCQFIADWTNNEVQCTDPKPVSTSCQAALRRSQRLQIFGYPFKPTTTTTVATTPSLQQLLAPAAVDKEKLESAFQLASGVIDAARAAGDQAAGYQRMKAASKRARAEESDSLRA